MDLTNTSSRRIAAKLLRQTAGFTIVEISMASAIGLLILAGVWTSYIMAARGFSAIANYWEIHIDGRYAVDRFAADMRGVSTVTSFATNGPLVVRIPITFSSQGVPTSSKTVTYAYSAGSLLRTDSSIGTTRILATNIYSLAFSLYDKLGNSTTVLGNAKGIQVDIRLRKYTAGKAQTEDYLSARLDMRNTP